MWLLSFVPDSLLHLAILCILFGGLSLYVLGLFINFVPPALPYREPIRILSTILIVAGVYFYGSYDTEMTWRNKVDELEAKVKVSEEKSKDANLKLDNAIKEKTKIVKETQVVIQERIKEVTSKIDSQCVIDPDVIRILNDAARPTK